MDNKKIILILIAVIAVLACMISFTLLSSYKEVDSNYVIAPLPNENVKFTGTYLGPYENNFNWDKKSGVIQVGNAYAIVSTAQLQGMEGQTVTVEGHFLNDKTDRQVVYINGGYVSGENFFIEKVI